MRKLFLVEIQGKLEKKENEIDAKFLIAEQLTEMDAVKKAFSRLEQHYNVPSAHFDNRFNVQLKEIGFVTNKKIKDGIVFESVESTPI